MGMRGALALSRILRRPSEPVWPYRRHEMSNFEFQTLAWFFLQNQSLIRHVTGWTIEQRRAKPERKSDSHKREPSPRLRELDFILDRRWTEENVNGHFFREKNHERARLFASENK